MVHPQRGLRQSCPLSPYLFILCAEAFSSLIHVAEVAKLIQGIRFSKDLMVLHLFFLDDSLIFCRAATRDCCSLKEIFNVYSVAFGQCFNFKKSLMLFSPNVCAAIRRVVTEIFGFTVVPAYERYLGLPAMVGRKKRRYFQELQHCVMTKLSGWYTKGFSRGGKEVLIKAVAQAIPSYAMRVFRLPVGFCNELQRKFTTF